MTRRYQVPCCCIFCLSSPTVIASDGKSMLPDHAPEHRSCMSSEGRAAVLFADITVDAFALSQIHLDLER